MLRRLQCALLTTIAAAAILTASADAAPAPPVALGVNLDAAPGAVSAMTSYAAMAGRSPAIVMWYQQWSEPLFYSTQLPNTASVGAIPMITWAPELDGKGIPLSAIANGSYDAYITASARSAAAWQQPIFIRFAHEMNLPGTVYGPGRNGNTPALFIAAWRHVVSIFRAEGATNVEWVFSPNVDCGGACPFTSFYPGDDWVDWVALDGYNYGPVDNVPWMTFDQLFGQSYATLTKVSSKPVMIAEVASGEAGGDKARWILQSFVSTLPHYSRVHAVVWFDRNKETDWRVNSSPASLAAWQAVVASPAYAGTASTLLSLTPTSDDVDSTPPVSSSGGGPASPGSGGDPSSPGPPPTGGLTTPLQTPALPWSTFGGDTGARPLSAAGSPHSAARTSSARHPGKHRKHHRRRRHAKRRPGAHRARR